jgi:UDP-N-acetylmuramate dehydrogenase
MDLLEFVPLRPKTTMRIGGVARYFAELTMKEDLEEAVKIAEEKKLPMIPLGSGSNTIFSDPINALIVQIKHADMKIDGNAVTVGAGKNLPMLINELAVKGYDLSGLTGIPGTVGGAIFGNAGQGPKGVWIDIFVESVTIYDGEWRTLTQGECGFGYRESTFKHYATPVLIWEVILKVPTGSSEKIKQQIEMLLKKRIETQPHMKTAGSCFKAVGSTPAWQLLDAAGLRGFSVGGIEISLKHANFLQNKGEGTYDDAVAVVEAAKKAVPDVLEVEMRFVEEDGGVRY